MIIWRYVASFTSTLPSPSQSPSINGVVVGCTEVVGCVVGFGVVGFGVVGFGDVVGITDVVGCVVVGTFESAV